MKSTTKARDDERDMRLVRAACHEAAAAECRAIAELHRVLPIGKRIWVYRENGAVVTAYAMPIGMEIGVRLDKECPIVAIGGDRDRTVSIESITIQ